MHKAAIIGAGPSGFYTAKYLLKAGIGVDLIEKLPCPYGLVRFGVAPDHQDVKAVMNDFNKIATDDKFRYFGNCKVGKDVSIDELQSMYDAVVFAYGASSEKKMNLKNEDDFVCGAKDFVAWYNANPELDVKVASEISQYVKNANHVVIVGNGNVALDCARLLVSPINELTKTDISSKALETLSKSNIRKVSVCGRRNHLNAAFTIKEVRDLTKIPGVSCEIKREELAEVSEKEFDDLERPKRRIHQLLTETSKVPLVKGNKIISLRFCLSPHEVDQFGMNMERTKMSGNVAQGTGDYEMLKSDFTLRSIGYHGEPIEKNMRFDLRKGIIPTEKGGRVVGALGLYATGWIKRGPTGILGTNIPDARETTEVIIFDLLNARKEKKKTNGSLELILQTRSVKFVDWNMALKIDQIETENGKLSGRPRVKMENIQEMLSV